MKKQLTEKTVYEPNSKVRVTVENSPVPEGESGITRYVRKVTIKVDVGRSNEKLTFADDDAIARFLENIDVEDPQQSLLNNKEES